jgi:hypothetical protein
MTPHQELIDRYVTETHIMVARLGDHLLTLDELRDSHKHESLAAFGFDDCLGISENVAALRVSHTERYDLHMANYLRYAHIVLTYMILENRLQAFGATVAATNRGPAFVPAGSRSLIRQFEDYLGSLGLSAPSRAQIDALRVLRNCIVHARGCLLQSRNASQIQSLVGTLDGTSVDSNTCLSFTTEGCLRLQEGVICYLHSIDRAAGFHIWVPDQVRASFERYIAPHFERAPGNT